MPNTINSKFSPTLSLILIRNYFQNFLKNYLEILFKSLTDETFGPLIPNIRAKRGRGKGGNCSPWILKKKIKNIDTLLL